MEETVGSQSRGSSPQAASSNPGTVCATGSRLTVATPGSAFTELIRLAAAYGTLIPHPVRRTGQEHAAFTLVIGRRGDLQLSADRLDPELLAVLIN